MKSVFFFISFVLLPFVFIAQPFPGKTKRKDTLHQQIDSTILTTDSSVYLNHQVKHKMNSPSSLILNEQIHNHYSFEGLFYIVLSLLLLLGVLRTTYAKYFTNLFRVFFQSSLRQSQLTDQLIQAKQPSLFLNLFFLFSGGIYVALMLRFFNSNIIFDWRVFFFATVSLFIVYALKYLTLTMTGWLTGFSKEAESYIFIVFLINKIIGLFLVPFIILMAFADLKIVEWSTYASLLIIFLLFMIRFFRLISVLQYRLNISRFHFFLYIIGAELMPILLIYKVAMIFITKNL